MPDRHCSTCHLLGPRALCGVDIAPSFDGYFLSSAVDRRHRCEVSDGCTDQVTSLSQVPRQIAHRYNATTRSVPWDLETERILLIAARAYRLARPEAHDVSPVGYRRAAYRLSVALTKFPVRNASVLVSGSVTPWVEALLHAHEAREVHTSDFKPRVGTSRLTRFVLVQDLLRRGAGSSGRSFRARFDAIVSFSSIEHDGLGRYCDPINADGDLAAVAEYREWLREGGLLFLAVPLGPDEPATIVGGNNERIYGRQRFARLVEGFDILWSVYNGADGGSGASGASGGGGSSANGTTAAAANLWPRTRPGPNRPGAQFVHVLRKRGGVV